MPDNNNLLLQKALTTSDLSFGVSRMNRTQADRFIDFTTNQAVMLRGDLVRMVRVDNPKGRISKMLFDTPITRGAVENTDPSFTVKPTYSSVDYDTIKLCTMMDISTETFEENIEGASHRDSLMQALATKMGEDFERVAIQGNTVTYAAQNDAYGYLLRTMDGWQKQTAAGTHVFDAAGATISKAVFSGMIRAMPNFYKMNRGALRFFCSPSIVQDYRDQLASRNTEFGDAALQGMIPLQVFGIPIVEVPLVPENLNSADGSQTWGNASFIWLTFPQNFIWFISRDIEVYWEFKARKDAWEATIYTKVGNTIENLDAFVYCKDVRVAGAS